MPLNLPTISAYQNFVSIAFRTTVMLVNPDHLTPQTDLTQVQQPTPSQEIILTEESAKPESLDNTKIRERIDKLNAIVSQKGLADKIIFEAHKQKLSQGKTKLRPKRIIRVAIDRDTFFNVEELLIPSAIFDQDALKAAENDFDTFSNMKETFKLLNQLVDPRLVENMTITSDLKIAIIFKPITGDDKARSYIGTFNKGGLNENKLILEEIGDYTRALLVTLRLGTNGMSKNEFDGVLSTFNSAAKKVNTPLIDEGTTIPGVQEGY